MARKVKSSLLRGSGPPARLPGPATEAEDDDAAPLRLRVGGPMRRIHISGDCKGLKPGPAGAGCKFLRSKAGLASCPQARLPALLTLRPELHHHPCQWPAVDRRPPGSCNGPGSSYPTHHPRSIAARPRAGCLPQSRRTIAVYQWHACRSSCLSAWAQPRGRRGRGPRALRPWASLG